MSTAPTYRHTQPGTLIRWALGVSLLGFLLLRISMGLPLSGADAIVGFVLLLIAAALVLMHSMTVIVEQGSLTVLCGPGYIRRSVPLSDIREYRKVRNAWYYGWGLRITPRGPLWRVSGFDAVELTLAKGRWLVGTDDPDGLVAALEHALSHPQGSSASESASDMA